MFEKINYIVTDLFSDRDIGEVLEAYLLLEFENGDCLVYHPPSKGEGDDAYEFCSSIDLCTHDHKSNLYYCVSKDSYKNLDLKELKTLSKDLSSLTNLVSNRKIIETESVKEILLNKKQRSTEREKVNLKKILSKKR